MDSMIGMQPWTKDPTGFRFEVLNRVDEILLFNEDLLQGARLPMKEGKHIVMASPGINEALSNLFYNGKSEVDGNNRDIFYVMMKALELSCLGQLKNGVAKFDGTECN